MRRCFIPQVFLAGLFLLLLCPGAGAINKIAIDGIHGQIRPETSFFNPNLDLLYPEIQFTRFNANRLPIHNLLAEGTLDASNYVDTMEVDVPAGVHALYVSVDGGPVFDQYPVAQIIRPDQEIVEGAYGVCHLDDPPAGHYLIRVLYSRTGLPYRIGTGPYIWEVYPPSDYDAVLDLHCWQWFFFTGEPTPRSPSDFTYMQQMLDVGGSVGLFYDGTEPIALKPIIHVRDFAREGASITLNLPGQVTYAVPQPQNVRPLTWKIEPTTADAEYDYEARFNQPLNFVAYSQAEEMITNRSWAKVRDLKIIEFVRGQGYRIAEPGTLEPGEKIESGGGVIQSYFDACAALDGSLRLEALKAEMTAEETESFFSKYQWAARILPACSDERGIMALYRIEGEDYDGLFPLNTDPQPEEMRRVLWVYSFLPERVREICAVHPRLTQTPSATSRRAGSYHEYGFFRETYGGDALDEMDQWGWHFYDQMLLDSTNFADYPGDILFHQWGASPLVARLSAGVTQIQGMMSGGIVPAAGTGEVILSGDQDTQCSNGGDPFPAGSYPPVIVARETALGGHLAGLSDFAFLGDMADNTQLVRNLFTWMSEGNSGEGPDIDLPTAVIENNVQEGGTAMSTYYIYNRGNQDLTIQTAFPDETWIRMTGPINVTVHPGDSVEYTLNWSGVDMNPGYYRAWWTFNTNDNNEEIFQWPLRLRVGDVSAIGPHPGEHLPGSFNLLPPSPNPFNPSTNVIFVMDRAGKVTLDLYNILGKHIERISDLNWPAGAHRLAIDLSRHSTGIYLLQARFGDHTAVQKLVLLK